MRKILAWKEKIIRTAAQQGLLKLLRTLLRYARAQNKNRG
jgi:hypothetical protein